MNRLHQILDRWVAESPDRIAGIDHDGQQYTFKKFTEAIDDTEQNLSLAGVGAGDRVMLVAENSVALITTILACSRLDAWALPVNARLTAAELKHISEHAKPRILVFTSKASNAAKSHAAKFSAHTPGQDIAGEIPTGGGRYSAGSEQPV